MEGMIRNCKGNVFARWFFAALMLLLVFGCGGQDSENSENDLTKRETDEEFLARFSTTWPEDVNPVDLARFEKLFPFLPFTYSEPCPFKSITFFTTEEQIIPREKTAKFYLVNIETGQIPKERVYLVDDQEAIKRVYRWLEQNGERLEKENNVALPFPDRFPWHHELLQYAANGDAVSYSKLDLNAGPGEHEKLLAIFRECGTQVKKLPGRKPPKVSDRIVPIEWEIEN